MQDELLRIRVSSAMYGGASCNLNMEAAQIDGCLELAGRREPLSGKQNGGWPRNAACAHAHTHAPIKAVFLILMNGEKNYIVLTFPFFAFFRDRVSSSSPGCNSLCRSSRPRVSRDCLVSVWL